MKKEKKHEVPCEEMNKAEEREEAIEDTGCPDGAETGGSSNKEMEEIKEQLESKSKQCEEYKDALQRMAAEFDNYKKRTAREKESIYVDAVSDVVSAFLPVVDNIERALQACAGDNSAQSLKEGFELVKRQAVNSLKSLGVEEIKSTGEEFNPEFHNAVMHVEDDTYGQNVIVEELQKGYMYKDKVIRYSMVKVAN